MKIRFILTVCLVFLFIKITAQTNTAISAELKWKGIERWHANDSIFRDVLTFEDAQHLGDDNLPFYLYSEAAEDSFSYQADLKNPVYIPLDALELKFLDGIFLTEQAQIETSVSNTRGNKTFHASVFPFVRQGNEFLKLKSFDLIIEKTPQTKRHTRASSIHTYADKSILSQGRFVKVRITESGVYKLTYSDLRSKGINPSNVRMFGYGGAVLNEDFSQAKHDDLPEIAVYDTGDAILFYAQGINKWSYNSSSSLFTHRINPYSVYGYYFVTSDNIGEKKRIQQKNEIDIPTSATVNDVTEFTDYRVHEKELNYILKSGREMYGEKFSSGSSINLPFSFPNILKTASLRIRIEVVQSSASSSSFLLKLDNLQRNINITTQSTLATHTFTPSSDDLNFTLSYSSNSNTNTGYLNYLEINAQRELKMVNSAMLFHNKENLSADSYNRYLLETNNANIQIWDINDQINVQQIPATRENGKLVFTDAALTAKSYFAIDPTSTAGISSATLLDEVANQNIHGMDAVDMLIITHPLFVKPAERLAEAHYEINGFKVGVVTTEQVYNEFSSGTPDATAYRWATKMFYDRPQNDNDKIRYLLLFGKGSFDNRGLFPTTGRNLVITYQSSNSLSHENTYSTDDYFGLLDDTEGTRLESSDKIDIGIGRFPVATEEDAYGVVNKTISYMRNENNGGWKNQLCFLGDDGDNNQHMTDVNRIADAIHQSHPSYNVNKILWDAYQQEVNASGESYPTAKNRFQNLLRSGLLFVAYMGHANASGWSNENVFTYNDANALRNKNLPLFSAGTCEFSYYDKELVSAGEELMRNPQGGGIGCFSATRVVYPNPNYILLKHFCDSLFNLKDERHMSIGDVVMKAKNATANSNSNNNKLKYIYFGDPAVKIRLPNQYEILAKEINGASITGNDTLRAMSVNTVKGIIANENGETNPEFNGTLQVIVQDKKETLLTLANDAGSTPMQYTDYPNTIFRGTTTVKNGEFEFTFMMPKDIKYNYGTGRMVFNAWSDDNQQEAQGHCKQFVVGGDSEHVENVTTGPSVNMYLNHPGFISGGKVNNTPIFTAHVSDQYGINISSPMPGHDIMLLIGNKSYVLNDYYEARQDTYKSGIVNYQLPELAEGHYTLMFRVWNLYNVSTAEYLNFEVVKNLSPEIFSVNCYPNPAITETNIVVNHDRDNEIISMTVDIFDLSGRKIWSRTQENSNVINWNLVKDSGEKVSSGMYIYRVSIKDGNKITSAKANKIIVKN